MYVGFGSKGWSPRSQNTYALCMLDVAVRDGLLDFKNNWWWEDHVVWRVRIHMADPANIGNELWWYTTELINWLRMGSRLLTYALYMLDLAWQRARAAPAWLACLTCTIMLPHAWDAAQIRQIRPSARALGAQVQVMGPSARRSNLSMRGLGIWRLNFMCGPWVFGLVFQGTSWAAWPWPDGSW